MAIDNNKIENSDTDNDEISLKELIIKIKDLVVFLKSKWKIFFIAAIIGGFIGLVIASIEKPTYKAVLTFAMEDDKVSGGGGGSSIVNIRFANYSQLLRTSNLDINQLYNNHLMALLGSYLNGSGHETGKKSNEMLDRSEEAMLAKGDSSNWQN